MGKQNISQRTIGTFIGYLSVLASVIVGFFSVNLLTKYLGDSEFGVYSLVASLVGYISIMDFGMHDVTVRYVSLYKAQNDAEGQSTFLGLTFKLYFLIDFLVLCIGVVLYWAIPMIFRNSYSITEILLTKRLFLVLLINLLISLPGAVFEAICVAYEKFILTKSLQLVKMMSKILIMLLLLINGARSIQLVWLDMVLNVVVLCIEAFYVLGKERVKIKFSKIDYNLLRNIIMFTFYIFLATISDQINWKIDSLILGVIKGTKAVALSAVGMQLVSVFRSIIAVIPGVYLPKVTKLANKDDSMDKLNELMISVGEIQLFIIGLILCGFVCVGKEFIYFWVGKNYEVAFYIFLVLAFALVIPSTQSIGINILEAKNMHGFRAKVYLCISIGNIILTVFTVKIWGVIGSAIATAVALFVGNGIVINWYYSKRVGLDIKTFFKKLYLKFMPLIFACGILSFIISNIIHNYLEGFWYIVVQSIITISIYIIVMAVFNIPQRIVVYIKESF